MMINLMLATAAGALSVSAQDIVSSTGVEADTTLVAQETIEDTAPVDLRAETQIEAELDAQETELDTALETQIAEIDSTAVDAIAKTEFEAADADGDDAVTEEEFVMAGLEAQGETEQAMDMAATSETEWGADVETEAEEDLGESPTSASAYLRERYALISNGDGELTDEEMATAIRQDFYAADSDADDKLTGAEVEVFAALRAGKTIQQ